VNRAGQDAEDAAAALLRAKGLVIVEKNFRAKVGEIDLVAKDKDEIVFVEVRSRSSIAFGGAAASVGGVKRRKLIKAALVWIQTNVYSGPCRFDVVAIDAGRAEHIPSAFDGSGR
jgi:putative endonuclease